MSEVSKQEHKNWKYRAWLTIFVALFFIFSLYIVSTADQYQIVSFESGYTFTADVIWFIVISWVVTTLGIFISDKLPMKTYSIKELVRLWTLQILIGVLIFLSLVIMTDYYLIDADYVAKDDWVEIRQFLFIGVCLMIIIMVIHNGRKLIRLWKDSVYENSQMKEIMLQCQVASLKAQLDPHFMFNNYSVLGSLIKEDSEKASQFLERLSDVHRYLLSNLEHDLVSLAKEIQFLIDYFYLMKIRFGDSIQVDISVKPELLGMKIPPMTLQLLLENAIKYNKATKKSPLNIKIYGEEEYLVIENNLQLLNNLPHSSKLGLTNIRKRYQLVEDREVVIEQTESVFRVRIPLLQDYDKSINSRR